MNLTELKELCRQATPGPWVEDAEAECVVAGNPCEPDVPMIPLTFSDCLFIAAAREAMPKLIAEVETLRKHLYGK